MSRGISTNRRVTTKAACLRQNSIDFVCRYYSHTTQQSEKRLTPQEAAAILQNGMSIVSVYEDGPTNPGYFSRDRGRSDGAHAHGFAQAIPQPTGTAIYFAVDYDATTATTQGAITEYFEGVKEGLAMAGGGSADYEVGVYGSGRVCQHLKESRGLARYSWLAESTGWAGFAAYATWNIKQSIATQSLCSFSGSAGDYEDNTGKQDLGGFGSAEPSGQISHEEQGGWVGSPGIPHGGANAPGGLTGGDTGSYVQRLAAKAREQYDGYHQFTENDAPLRAQIRKYWEDLDLDFPGVDTAWSAVFISWCVRQAGASQEEFRASTAHSRFVFRAIQNQLNETGVFRGRRLGEYKPKVGDILHNNRGGQSVSYDFAAAHEAYASHSAIVVELGQGFVRTIGGNEGDSVGLKRVDLTPDGFVQQRNPNPYICLIETLKT